MSGVNLEHICYKIPHYAYVKHPTLAEKYPLVSCVDQDHFDGTMRYKANSDDLFIVSYPKSGTTWLQNIFYLLRNNGVPLEKEGYINNTVPFLEFSGIGSVENAPRPRIIKTHLYRCMIPFHDEAKYVFVARNPKDVVVSLYYHTISNERLYKYKDGKLGDFFEVFMAGACASGDYFKLVPEWFRESQIRSNVYMMLYEDMKSDIESEILKLSDFLADGTRQKLLANNKRLLNDVILHSSFDKMESTYERFKGRTLLPTVDKTSIDYKRYHGVMDVHYQCVTVESRPKDMPFFRKGVIGDWINHLSRDQSERIERKMLETDDQYAGFAKLWKKYDNLLKY